MKANVLLITYNHEKYIAQALESILMQETDFDFNIVVADDKSTDYTVDIIKKYEKKTPISFRYIAAEENLGTTKNYGRAFAQCDAEYVAILEGDDFWTTPKRLQRHVDFLDEHRECVMCLNRFYLFNSNTAIYQLPALGLCSDGWALYTSQDIIRDNRIVGNFSACTYRTSELRQLPPKLFEGVAYEYTVNIVLGLHGFIGALSAAMNAYRIHDSGVWSALSEKERLTQMLDLIDVNQELTGHRFDKDFENLRATIIRQLSRVDHAWLRTDFKHSIRAVASKAVQWLPPIIKWILQAFIPPTIWNKLKGN